MRVNEMSRDGRGHTSALVFEKGDEVVEVLKAHARRAGIRAAHFTAFGAFRSAILAYFDWKTKEYVEIPVDEQAEVTSLVGDIGVHDGEPVVHAHCVLGQQDGSPLAGHLLEGHVRPTLELFLHAHDGELTRATDEESGLPLIQ
jgi:predicted DNA-binding protein with PD1-like motif